MSDEEKHTFCRGKYSSRLDRWLVNGTWDCESIKPGPSDHAMVTIRKEKEKRNKFWRLNVSILYNKQMEKQIQEHIDKYGEVKSMRQ